MHTTLRLKAIATITMATTTVATTVVTGVEVTVPITTAVATIASTIANVANIRNTFQLYMLINLSFANR